MRITSEYININNSNQNIMTICADDNNPVLLIVHGGAGSPDRPLVQKYNSELANYYTVVCWDQRGSGLSYTKEQLIIKIMLDDLKAVVEYLREKYQQDKIYIAGHSWGAYLGLRFASMHPEYVKYYIGTGQGISSLVDEIDKYNFVKEEAIKRNDEKVLSKLNFFGEPSGYTYQTDDEAAKKYVGNMIHKYGGYISEKNDFSIAKYFAPYFKCYGWNIIKVLKGMVKSSTTLNAEMNEEDSISCITELSVPVLLISGEEDMICPVSATQRWFDKLTAPQKKFVKIKNAAHMVNFEQPEEWNKLLIGLKQKTVDNINDNLKKFINDFEKLKEYFSEKYPNDVNLKTKLESWQNEIQSYPLDIPENCFCEYYDANIEFEDENILAQCPIDINISKLINKSKAFKVEKFKVSELIILVPDDTKCEYVDLCTKSTNPILVLYDDVFKPQIIDGNHRVIRAHKNGEQLIPGIHITTSDLKGCFDNKIFELIIEIFCTLKSIT